jgi:SAC3 domain-containing protein 1
MVLFMSFCLYRLSDLQISHFDPKICKQHLYECLLKCLICYDKLDLMKKEDGYKSQNRQIIESIYMLTNMNEFCAWERALKLDARLRESHLIKQSIGILIAYHQREFYKILQAIPKLPSPIVCAIASLQLCEIRKEMLQMFSIAFNSQSLQVPVNFLQRLLIYDDSKILFSHLHLLGILDSPSSSSAPQEILFNRKKFDSTKTLVSYLIKSI